MLAALEIIPAEDVAEAVSLVSCRWMDALILS